MTEWTSETTTQTSWNAGDGINRNVSILYNADVPYNADYITYNGHYIENETDWNDNTTIETSWKAKE